MARSRLSPWLLGALALHAGALWLAFPHVVSTMPGVPTPVAPRERDELRETWDVEWLESTELLEEQSPESDTTSDNPSPAERRAPKVGEEPKHRVSSTAGAPSRSDEVVPNEDPHPAGEQATGKDDSASRDALPGGEQRPGTNETAQPPKRLSLQDIGYGSRSPWVLPDAVEPPQYDYEDRLERNMAQATLDYEEQHSMGIAAPIIVALNRAASSTVAPRSTARVAVSVHSDGSVTAVEVQSASKGFATWNAAARRALELLRAQRIRVPEGRQLVLVLECESQVLLPSGQKETSGVSVLGIPIGQSKKGQEPTVEFLKPRAGVEMQEVPDPYRPGEVMHLPRLDVGISLFESRFDPVDLAAHARQVVRTKLISQQVL